MTKKQRRERIHQIQDELLDLLRAKYPDIELLEIEDRPTGHVVFHIHAPYQNTVGVLRQVRDRIGELLLEGMAVLVIPHREKRTDQAA